MHAGWQVAVVALIVFVILRVSQNRISSQLRYALLLIVLLKFATPPFLSLPIGMFSQPSVAQFTDVTPTPVFNSTVETVTSDQSNLKSPVTPQPPLETQVATSTGVEASSQADIPTKSKKSQTTEFSTYRLIACLFLLVYVPGVILYLVRLISQYVSIRKQVLASECRSTGSLQGRLHQLSQQLGMKSCPELRISNNLDAPFAIGAIRPIIVLPQETIHQLDSDQLDIVMAHELAHVRRRDMLIGWFETLLTALWWFHPAIWWLKSSLRQTREDCCDDMLIANQITKPDRYCETIIQAAAYKTTPSSGASCVGLHE